MNHIYLSHYANCPTKEKYNTEHHLGLKLLSQGLKALYQIDISEDSIEDYIEKNDYGKPYLTSYPDIHFNISHCDGIVACGFSDTILGVDIEMIDEFRPAILKKVFTESERRELENYKDYPELYQTFFCRFWTLKESRIKQAGLGFSMSVTDFSFHFDGDPKQPVPVCSEPDLYFYQEIIENKYVLAVCSDNNLDDVLISYL